MNRYVPHKKKRPEDIVVENLTLYLRARGWYVKKMHGNVFQSGFPDLFCCHPNIGIRLIEVKEPNRTGEPFTKAQLQEFPMISAHSKPGEGVWVLVGATEQEYTKLFEPANYWQFLSCMGGMGMRKTQ